MTRSRRPGGSIAMAREPEPSNRPVRIKDIAEEAGVSYPVASLALAGKKDRNVRYGEDTRERVLAVAERLGYRLNRSARNFARSRHGSLAIVTNSVYQFSRMTLNALTLAAMERDLTVFLDCTRQGELPRCIEEDMADGVVVFGAIMPDVDEALDRIGIPTVRVNTNRTEGDGVVTYDERARHADARRGVREAGTPTDRPARRRYGQPPSAGPLQRSDAANGTASRLQGPRARRAATSEAPSGGHRKRPGESAGGSPGRRRVHRSRAVPARGVPPGAMHSASGSARTSPSCVTNPTGTRVS